MNYLQNGCAEVQLLYFTDWVEIQNGCAEVQILSFTDWVEIRKLTFIYINLRSIYKNKLYLHPL